MLSAQRPIEARAPGGTSRNERVSLRTARPMTWMPFLLFSNIVEMARSVFDKYVTEFGQHNAMFSIANIFLGITAKKGGEDFPC